MENLCTIIERCNYNYCTHSRDLRPFRRNPFGRGVDDCQQFRRKCLANRCQLTIRQSVKGVIVAPFFLGRVYLYKFKMMLLVNDFYQFNCTKLISSDCRYNILKRPGQINKYIHYYLSECSYHSKTIYIAEFRIAVFGRSVAMRAR